MKWEFHVCDAELWWSFLFFMNTLRPKLGTAPASKEDKFSEELPGPGIHLLPSMVESGGAIATYKFTTCLGSSNGYHVRLDLFP